MYRSHLEHISDWATRKTRKPLIIRGARQVGKTTLVRLACERLNLSLVEINLEDQHDFIKLLPQNDPHKVLQAIALADNLPTLDPDKHLIFFDEAQACPRLIPFLRYCFERAPEYRIILTGSLLEFVLRAQNFSFPVGRVEFLYLGPMTFEEYLGGIGKQVLAERIGRFSLTEPPDEAEHSLLMKELRLFLIIGGMPEAINTFRDTASFLEVERCKQGIITAYQADFHKYRGATEVELVNRVFASIPLQIGEKTKYTRLVQGQRSEKVKHIVDLLELARVIQRCYHSHADGLPLSAQQKTNFFKLLFLDVGLVQSMLGVSLAMIESSGEINEIAKGCLAEQFIGQHLAYDGPAFQAPTIHYWERQSKHSIAEVDFLVAWQQEALPVEVKSGHKGHMKSLQQFIAEKRASHALRFSSGPLMVRDYKHASRPLAYRFLNIPHYLVSRWRHLTDTAFS